MKLTLFIQNFSDGGAQHMIVNTANEFAKRGHDVDLLVVNGNGPHIDKVEKDVHLVNLGKRRSLAALWGLSRYIRTRQPDIFLSAMTHTNIVSVMARFLAPFSSTRLILTERTLLSMHIRETPRLQEKFFLAGVKFFYRFADKVIGISRGVAEDIQSLARLKPHQVGYIYNPVITSAMQAQLRETSSDLMPEKKDGAFLIVTSGRLSYEKDQETLLKAFEKLRHTHNAKLVILGDGPLRADLERQVEELGIQNHVVFAGFVPNSLAYMKQADLFVITSLYEGFCNVIVEALLCGLSVVSTNAPSGPPEILEEGKYGLLAPVGNSNAIAQAMAQALKEPFDPQKQKERASCFTVEKICDQYEALFQIMIERQPERQE